MYPAHGEVLSDGEEYFMHGTDTGVDGRGFLALGDDDTRGRAVSASFYVPKQAYWFAWRRGGGADPPSGLFLRRKVDKKPICGPTGAHGEDTNDLRSRRCDLRAFQASKYASEPVFVEVRDVSEGGWAKVQVDHLRFLGEDAASEIPPLRCPLTTTTVSTTTTTKSTTTGTANALLHHRIDKLGTNLSAVVADAVDALELKVQSQAATIESQAAQLATQKEAADGLAAKVEMLTRRVEAMLAPAPRAERPDDAGCTDGPCPPAVEATEGQSLALSALEGRVTFASADCPATDLCELSQDLRAFLKKFDDIE